MSKWTKDAPNVNMAKLHDEQAFHSFNIFLIGLIRGRTVILVVTLAIWQVGATWPDNSGKGFFFIGKQDIINYKAVE